MRNIKIGVCDWALPGAGLYATRIAKDFGLNVLSLKIGMFENNYPLAEKYMQKYYLEDQQKYGLEYCAVALNDFDNMPIHARENSSDYDKAWTLLKKGLQTAVALKIPMIQVPGFAKSEIKTEEDYIYTAKAFQYLCDEAGEHGIYVASENLLKPEQFKILYEMVDRKNFGVYYDSQNYHVFKGYNQTEILEGLYPYMVRQLHVKDGKGVISGALLGRGDANFYGTMELLGQKGYEGYLLLENYYDWIPLRLQGESPYQLLEADIKTLRDAVTRYLTSIQVVGKDSGESSIGNEA
jgi:L-ribulose-5-phosphate 3-epimerase UlaE